MKTPDIIPRSTVWADYIREFLTLDGKRRQEQDLEAVLNEAVEVEYMHEGRVGSLGKSSQYNRNMVDSLYNSLNNNQLSDNKILFHSFVNPAERIVTIDPEMTRTRYGLESTNQSIEVEDRNKGSFTRLLGRGIIKWRCPWGIVCKSSQVNNYQAVRSFENDNTEEFR